MIRVLAVLFGLVVLVCGGSDVALAQAGLEDEPACLVNPHSEECVCAQVLGLGYYPVGYEIEGSGADRQILPKDINKDGERPVFNEDTGEWEEWAPAPVPGVLGPAVPPCDPEVKDSCDLKWVDNPRYGQECSLEYVREDLNRLWKFVGALAAGLATVSFCWVGFVYMQESASGGDLSRVRNMLVRVFVGMIIVGCAVVIWEGVSGGLFGSKDSWSMERGVYHQWRR